MIHSRDKRLSDLEALLHRDQGRDCGICHGSGIMVLAVPEDVSPDDPAYLPETCPECGVLVRNVLRIIGMTEEQLP